MSKIRSLLKLLILGCSLGFVQTVIGATASIINVQTKQGVALDVDLSNSITTTGALQPITFGTITINGVVSIGAVVAQEISLSPPVIRITPGAFVSGLVTVSYSITDQGTPASSTINVNVIPTDLQQDSQVIAAVETPRGAVAKYLINTCEDLD